MRFVFNGIRVVNRQGMILSLFQFAKKFAALQKSLGYSVPRGILAAGLSCTLGLRAKGFPSIAMTAESSV